MHDQGTRTPQSGDTLILTDGRRFVVESVDQSPHGCWFKARALDGSCLLQANLALCWDGVTRAWYPGPREGAATAAPLPPSRQRSSQPGVKQNR